MGNAAHGETTGTGTLGTGALGPHAPGSVDAAFRRVRWLAGALVLIRLWTTDSIPHVAAVGLVLAFWSVNLLGIAAERRDPARRVLLDVAQLLADTVIVLLFAWAQHDPRVGAETADWAVLVLPAIEGAMRLRVGGAIATWLILAAGYAEANAHSTPSLDGATIAQRLTVVLLVALPVGYLAGHLVADIASHRREKDRAERRARLLRVAAAAGRQASRLDVDEILEVICNTIVDMGFVEPRVFALMEPIGDDPRPAVARPVRGSSREVLVGADDPALLAAITAAETESAVVRPPDLDTLGERAPLTLFALPIPMVDVQRVVLTAFWPGAGPLPGAPVESLELFAAQAGASLNNAQVHRRLEELKDRLDHEASHDPLTELANRRRFTDELALVARRGRPGDYLAVLFLDLDGFKEVNDRYGHDAGNELLVAVAARLRACMRAGDLVARIGGDEFTVMLTRLETVAPATAIAARICDLLSDPYLVGRQEIHISTSVGVALAPADRADIDDLLRRADTAMYRAKAEGKARWMMDTESLDLAASADGHGRKNP